MNINQCGKRLRFTCKIIQNRLIQTLRENNRGVSKRQIASTYDKYHPLSIKSSSRKKKFDPHDLINIACIGRTINQADRCLITILRENNRGISRRKIASTYDKYHLLSINGASRKE
jgi:hypothetical protein